MSTAIQADTGTDPDKLADLLDQAAQDSEQAAQSLQSLIPPPAFAALAGRLSQLRVDLTSTLRLLATSYRAGNSVEIKLDLTHLKELGDELKRLSAQYGLTQCGVAP